MNLIKPLSIAAVLAMAGEAHATCYYTTGTMTGMRIVPSPVNAFYVHAGLTTFNSSPSVFPHFSGSICIDTAASPALASGVFADFEQFSTSFLLGGGGTTAVVNQPNLVYSFNGGTSTWTQAPSPAVIGEGTFKLGQTMTLTGGNSQTSDASLLFDTANGALSSTCSGITIYCSGQLTWFIPYPNQERFFMTVTIAYDAGLGKFVLTGNAVGADIGGGTTGNYWYSYSFSGTEI